MNDMKVSMKLFISFMIIIGLTVIVGIVGIVGMMRINAGSIEMFESQSQPLADLGMAREYFQRLRAQLRDVVLASGDNETLDTIEAYLTTHENAFLSYMESYRATISESDMVALYDEIMVTFGVYQPFMQQIIASARANAPHVQMIIMMDGLTVPTDAIVEALYYMAYRRVLQAAFLNDVNNAWFNLLFSLIIFIIFLCAAVALFLTKHVSNLISKPLAEIGFFAEKVSSGEINMLSVVENSINVRSADEVGILARMLEQSYIQLNALEHSKRKMESIAFTDTLTGVSTRHYFMEKAEQELAESNRQNYNFHLLMMDVDFFKNVNDKYGHQIGDQVLSIVASRMLNITRRSDTVIARYGGEEFIIMLSDMDYKDAVNTACRIRQKIMESRFKVNDLQLNITVSLGVATKSDPEESLSNIIHNADMALYEAKRTGRNKVVEYIDILPAREARIWKKEQ